MSFWLKQNKKPGSESSRAGFYSFISSLSSLLSSPVITFISSSLILIPEDKFYRIVNAAFNFQYKLTSEDFAGLFVDSFDVFSLHRVVLGDFFSVNFDIAEGFLKFLGYFFVQKLSKISIKE